MNGILFLNADLMPDWVVVSFPIFRIIFVAIMALCAIAIITTTLMQASKSNSISAISGTQESFYSQNKSQTRDGRLKKLTIIFASVLVSVVLLYFISCLIYPAI